MIGTGAQHVIPTHAAFANHAMLAWPIQSGASGGRADLAPESSQAESCAPVDPASQVGAVQNSTFALPGQEHVSQEQEFDQKFPSYQVVYREEVPSAVPSHPAENCTPPSNIKEPHGSSTVDILIQEAHRLYREQNYAAVLSICENVQTLRPNSTDNLLLMGAAYFHLGEYQSSVHCNDFCILLDPQIAEAHANLANSLQQLGHLPMAALYYQTALRIQPGFTDACTNLAAIFSQMGDLQQAVEYYAHALRINPRLPEVHQSLGELWLSQGAAGLAAAQRCFQEVLMLQPQSAAAWRGLGDASRDAGDFNKAIEMYKEAVSIHPDLLEALTGLGLSYKELGSLQQAEEAFEAVLRLQPDNALALGNLAGLYVDQGKLAHAVTAYQQAIRLQPNFPEAYNNLGNTLRELGRADEAIACYTACIQLQYAQQHSAGSSFAQVQRLSVAFSNLGGILKMQGRLQDAIACYEHVSLLQPQVPEVQANVAAAYKDAARHDQAISAYMRALQLKPDFPEAFANLVHSLQSVCEWRDRSSLFQRLEGEVRRALGKDELPAVQPFHAMSYPFPADLALAISKRYAQHYALSAAEMKLPAFAHPPARALAPGERLRVAYVSSDFMNHPLSHLMASVFGMHDRSQVEVFCYALMPSDGSEWRKRIEEEAEHFIDVSTWPTADIAARISGDKIHIAVNLNGYTKGARNEIFPLRPAPVQCAYMGFPATMGASYLPYLITDPVVAPPHLHHCYSEALALMPHCYFINDYKQAHLDLLDERNLPKRSEFGLPEDKIIFACSNQLYKYDPETFATWMRILKRVPDSVLWLLRFPAYGEPRIYAEAAMHGVPAERIIFTDVAQKRTHIARSGLADVFLDTPLCNAHTTGCDVLWGGTPAVTLPLERMASRVCASLCMATGYGDQMVVSSQEEYEERAVEFGSDSGKRLALREKLKAARLSCPLFDTKRWVQNLERVYARMWSIHCTGQDPHSFHVSECDPLPVQPEHSG